MTQYGRGAYQIPTGGLTNDQIVIECNKIFSVIADRLDQMEGLRGEPRFYNRAIAEDDVVCIDSSKGLVLFDGTNYWRVEVSTSGTLSATSLGKSYS